MKAVETASTSPGGGGTEEELGENRGVNVWRQHGRASGAGIFWRQT